MSDPFAEQRKREGWEWQQVQSMLPAIQASPELTKTFLTACMLHFLQTWDPTKISPTNLAVIDRHYMLKEKQA